MQNFLQGLCTAFLRMQASFQHLRRLWAAPCACCLAGVLGKAPGAPLPDDPPVSDMHADPAPCTASSIVYFTSTR